MYWYILGEVTKNMFLKTVCFIAVLTVSKIHFSKPHNATSAVTFERLEIQIKKDSKYITIIFYIPLATPFPRPLCYQLNKLIIQTI